MVSIGCYRNIESLLKKVWGDCEEDVMFKLKMRWLKDGVFQDKDKIRTKYEGIKEKHTFGKHKFFIQKHILNTFMETSGILCTEGTKVKDAINKDKII